MIDTSAGVSVKFYNLINLEGRPWWACNFFNLDKEISISPTNWNGNL